MKNKRILIIPPIVLYVLWLILIPILFHGQYWEKLEAPAIASLYLISTAGLFAVGTVITIVIVTIGLCIDGLIKWIKEGIPEEKPDILFREAEKEVDEYLENDR